MALCVPNNELAKRELVPILGVHVQRLNRAWKGGAKLACAAILASLV